MEMQKTITKEITHVGVGLHTGNETRINFKPAPPDTGFTFLRVDLPGRPEIKADIDHVVDVARGTTLGINGVKVHTVEHVLAALLGLGIDNIVMEIDANEPPVVDGSSMPFTETLMKAGIEEQEEPKRYWKTREPVWIQENDVFLVVVPSDEFKISFTIDYNHPALRGQYKSLVINDKVFHEEISSARTYCFLNEVETLQEQGLIKGGSLENAVVIGEESIPKEHLRFEDEFVRHKMLDLVGDLCLLGKPIKGHIIAVKSGHALNVKLVQKMKRRGERKSGILAKPTGENIWAKGYKLDAEDIKRIIPHRYPFLLVDKIVYSDGDKHIVGVKNISINEYFFQGHFPGQPIMPGVLVVESMAQTAGVLLLSKPENAGKFAYFMGIDNVKFRKPVLPGDQLMLEIESVKIKSKTGKVMAKAYVDGLLVCEANLMFAFSSQEPREEKSILREKVEVNG